MQRTLKQIVQDQLNTAYPIAVTLALAIAANNVQAAESCKWYDQVCELERDIKPTWLGR